MMWSFAGHSFDLDERALVMGVVNITPDSFSDGGRHLAPAAAIAHARTFLSEGADLLDLGAESTRPGAAPVDPAEQLSRLLPVIEALAPLGATLSVDTTSAAVAARALAAGATVVNDVSALGDPAMASVVAQRRAGLVLMHMQGTPETMQSNPRYQDVTREVREWLAERLAVARAGGIEADCVALDPGIGFGKTLGHNLELIARLDEIAALGRPLVIGVSRKSFIGKLTGADVGERLAGSLAAAAIAVFAGARIVRAHDVAETRQAARIAQALAGARRGSPEHS